MSRRHPSSAMSLFSYLDGLVCTMGALILLLLMTAQRMKDQVIERHQTEQQQLVADAEEQDLSIPEVHQPDTLAALELNPPNLIPHMEDDSPVQPVPVLPTPQITAVDPVMPDEPDPEQVEFERELREREELIAQLHRERQRLLAEHSSQAESDQKRWLQQVAELRQQSAELQKQLAEKRSLVAVASGTTADLVEEKSKLEELVSTVQAKSISAQEQRDQYQKEIDRLMDQRERSVKSIDTAQFRRSIKRPVFEIETRESDKGTSRRPIIIECTADSLIFASEQISLSAGTLDRFQPEMNPLLAGADALINYWSLQDAAAGDVNSQPYVLLIVRPEGTIGFYVARKYLEGLGQEFGYELVGSKTQFKWPAQDPQAKKECQAAIDQVMNGQRPEMLKHRLASVGGRLSLGREPAPTPKGLPGQADGKPIVGQDGSFTLQEVDEMKNHRPSNSLNMLGPEWRKPQREQGIQSRTGTGPGAAPNRGTGNNSAVQQENPASESVPQRGVARLDPEGQSEIPPANSDSDQTMSTDPFYDESVSGDPDSQTEMGQIPQERSRSNPLIQPRSQQSVANSSPRTPQPENSLPPPPIRATVDQTNTVWKPDGGPQRQWGKVRHSGSIGFEKRVILNLYPDRIAIEGGVVIDLTGTFTRQDFQEAVAVMIDEHVRSWGDPPSNFVYRPAFEVKVFPGGGKHYLMLKQLLEHWGLKYRMDNVTE